MAKDQQGLTLAGAPESAAAFDRAIADYYGLTGDPVGILKQALARDPGFALGGAAIAALYMIGGFRGDHPEVAKALGAAEPAMRRASGRERRHFAAANAWAEGRTSQAIADWETILVDHPTDALALRLVQDAYFFLGRSAAIRDCAARVLPAWDAETRSPASSSAFTPSGSRKPATSSAPRPLAARRWRGTRATPGRRMRSLT